MARRDDRGVGSGESALLEIEFERGEGRARPRELCFRGSDRLFGGLPILDRDRVEGARAFGPFEGGLGETELRLAEGDACREFCETLRL